MPWVRDGVGKWESESIEWLARMARDNEGAASRILDMPFLETHEPSDAAMLYSLYDTGRRGKLHLLMAQQMLSEGIEDTEIPLAIAGAFIASRGDPNTLERLLDPGYADVETLERGTEQSPHMKFSIVRTGSEAQPWVMDSLFDSLELLERTMGQPLPVSHVVAVISDESTCGCTTGFAFDVPPEWHKARKDSPEGQRFQGHNVHELSHYYWREIDQWVNEGIARVFEYLYGVAFGLDPVAYKNWRGRCEAHDLQMHMDLTARRTPDEYNCRHYLGGELFRELRQHLGTTEFTTRLNQIHRLYVEEKEQRGDRHLGIDEVRRVFAGESDIVEKHWSGKLNAPENRWMAEMSSQSHNLIRWDQHPVYDGDTITFSGTLLGDADLSSGTIAQTRNDNYQNFHLFTVENSRFIGNIFHPDWTHGTRHPGDNIALEYRLQGRTFTVRFRLPESLGNPADYVVDVWGFRDESRTAVIWPDRDRLGYARIRVE